MNMNTNKIRFILEIVSSRVDRAGNTYHWARITSTATGRDLVISDIGGPSNARSHLRKFVPGLDFGEIFSVESTLGVRDWKRSQALANGGRPIYEHDLTPAMFAALESPDSVATRIADELGGDGQVFPPFFSSLLGAHGSKVCDNANDRVRWVFPDGSAIVEAGPAWDIGITGASDECFCWSSADRGRHSDTCPDAPPTELSKITTTAGSLQSGDRIGRPDRAPVRYSTLSDTGAAWLVYVEGENHPRRYGRNEPLTVFRS
jgi:hypothetical protein